VNVKEEWLIPQFVEVLGISEDALYAALGLLPPSISK